ncbi:MAG: beta-ketoacyl synthase N-terminal-like domain-containing protein [Planctomycetota bacterium]
MANASAGIVVTGAGLATSLGVGREAVWSAVRGGGVGLGPYRAIEDPAQAERGGGEVPAAAGIDLDGGPRTSAYLRFAVEEALRHAGLVVGESWAYPPERCGLMLGTTLHGMGAAGRMVRRGSAEPLRDFLAPAVAARATGHLPLAGFSATTCSACSSGLGSLLLAATLLRAGELDLVVAGGYDPISEYAYAGFNALRLVDERPPRPFARDRAGMKVSEGYGIVVMERAATAARRGVSPFLWLRGGGESADAHHLTQPRPDGGGAARAIAVALDEAAIDTRDVDLIVAHATGTPDNDAAEVAAYRGVFGAALADTPVVGLKSRLGHTLGAAGSAELILAGLALRDGTLPTTATTTDDGTDFEGVRIVTGDARPESLRTAVNTSLGFGGANTCVVTSLAPGNNRRTATEPREVWVTGVGVVTPDAVGCDAFVKHARSGREPTPGPVSDDAYLHLLQARRVRRLSNYVKLSLAAARLAADDAGLDTLDEAQRDAFTADCAAVLGTAHGSTKHSYAYYRGLVDEGYAAANPMLFAEGVPNAGAAHLSMGLNLRGGCQSIIGSRTAGLDALRLATIRLVLGEGDRAVVCAGEEHDPLVERCYAELGLPTPTAAGAVALVLEARPAAEARGARCRGVVGMGSGANFGRDLRAGVRGIDLIVARNVAKGRARVIGCGGPGWLGRFEAAGLRRAGVPSSRFAGMAEGFSTTPLAAVAAALGGSEMTLVVAADFHGTATGVRVRPANH